MVHHQTSISLQHPARRTTIRLTEVSTLCRENQVLDLGRISQRRELFPILMGQRLRFIFIVDGFR